jgi:hypothetical protein
VIATSLFKSAALRQFCAGIFDRALSPVPTAANRLYARRARATSRRTNINQFPATENIAFSALFPSHICHAP